MDVCKAITGRRSIRKFKEKPVAYAILEKCVEAARLAPSAMNGQVCEYIVVDDEQMLPQVLNTVSLWAGVPRPESGWSGEHRPRAYIVTMVNTGLAEKSAGRRNADYDAALAVENMVLTAQGEGLGSCVITSFSKDRLKQVLGIPDGYEAAILLALGYADENPVIEVTADSTRRWTDDNGVLHVPKRRLEDILHRNRFPD